MDFESNAGRAVADGARGGGDGAVTDDAVSGRSGSCAPESADRTLSHAAPRNYHVLLKITEGECGEYAELHRQREADLVYIFKGGDIEVNLAGNTTRCSAPAVLLIPGDQVHGIRCGADSKVAHVLFDPALLQLTRFDEAQSNLMPSLSDGMIESTLPIRVGDPGFERLCGHMDFLCENASTHEAGMRLQVKGCLLQVLGLLYQYGYLNKRPIRRAMNRNTKADRIRDLLDYIKDNYDKPLSISDAAGRMDLSKQYFCRFFKDLTGSSFVEYLNNIRLNRIAHDILNTDDGINEIAERHGFDSISHFFKMFKQRYNCTPNRYRQSRGADATITGGAPGASGAAGGSDENGGSGAA